MPALAVSTLPGRSISSHEVPQTDGELTGAEAAKKPPGPAPHQRSAVVLLSGASALCVAGALLWWAGSGPAPTGLFTLARPALGRGRGEDGVGVVRHVSFTSVGRPEECSGYHEGCLETGCCSEVGEECFQKDAWWAQCLQTCLDTDLDPWTCKVMGPAAATKENGTVPGALKAKTTGDPACAKNDENCMDLKCCADPDTKCYVKDESWAGCRQTCEEGKHDPDGPDLAPWSCADAASIEEEEPDENETAKEDAEGKQEEGDDKHRRVKLQPCSWNGENCNASKCCNEPGMMCYSKNEYWAECLEVCDAGENDTAGPDQLPWSCGELGMRTAATKQETQKKVGVCTMRGEDCSQTKCCEDVGFLCYEKNASFSGCRNECKAGLYDPTGVDWLPWTCVVNLKSEAVPTVSTSEPQLTSVPIVLADRVFGVALAAIQEEVEEIDIKEMMATSQG